MTFRLVSSGYLVLVLILTIIFLALCSPSNSNFALFFGFSLISTSLVSIWLTRRNILGLSVTPVADRKHSSTREPLRFRLHVNNPSRLHRPSLTLRLGNQAIKRFELLPMDNQQLHIELNHNGRGCYHIDQLSLTTDYPIGLFRIRLPLTFALQTWVLPCAPTLTKTHALINTPTVEGDREIDGLYEYNNSDSLNTIHWKTYAKTQKLVVKHFVPEESAALPHIWLDWNTNDQPTEARILHLVAQADWAQRNNFQFGLRLPHIEIPQGIGNIHYQRCLLQLASFQCPQESIMPGLTRGKTSASL